MTEKKSYFSKKAISEIIEEVIEYMNRLNVDVPDYVKPNKETVGSYLVAEEKINDAIYDTLTDGKKDFGNCHAMVKKGRCGNPITKVNRTFCALHTNRPVDMTYLEYERLQAINKKVVINNAKK